eukprot:TRINITY_DN3195_c0_g2_i1.p1 TRINITY_DN3195_c0_g2~~TRINITY_DN3195_c0_g2_i1.p1  ORF type:complete len:173 (-),score=11.95 TRINITY_DN3195_c0_g2_i1:596-1114(-)
MTTWHCHIAMSLDGKIARADGSFDWLMPYPPQDFGIEEFTSGVSVVIMGRNTFEVERTMAVWPHSGKQVFVVTSSPIENLPPNVEAWQGGLESLAALFEQRGYHKVGVEGGGQLIRGLIEIGKLDVLEMAIIPLVLGEGIPLFPSGMPALPLTLLSCEVKTGGALHVVYRRA